jgi:radical SAM-linked protein
MQRIRIAYEKGVELQYTGNLDMHKVWERTFRRAHLPLAYSQGFHPQPKIQQAAPLPLGFTSKAEKLDVWLDTDDPIESITRKLVNTVQPGITIQQVLSISLTSEALPNLIAAAGYQVTPDEPLDLPVLEDKITWLLSASTIERERRGKKYDLRPLIQSLVFEDGHPVRLNIRLTSLPGATGRPEEVLEELGLDPFAVDIERTELLFKQG